MLYSVVLGCNGVLVDGSKVDTLNTPIIRQEGENPVEGEQPEQGKSMVAAFTMVSFGGIGWRVINDGYSQVVFVSKFSADMVHLHSLVVIYPLPTPQLTLILCLRSTGFNLDLTFLIEVLLPLQVLVMAYKP